MVKIIYNRLFSTTKINKLPIIIIILSFLLIIILNFLSGKKYVTFNHTESIPIGFYSLNYNFANDTIKNNDFIVFNAPYQFKKLAVDRKWINNNDTLIKPVKAKKGDKVCTLNKTVKVNNISYGTIRNTDSKNRNMPWFKYCKNVSKKLFFVFLNNPKSFDSRYYGPIKFSNIIAIAKPLWTF